MTIFVVLEHKINQFRPYGIKLYSSQSFVKRSLIRWLKKTLDTLYILIWLIVKNYIALFKLCTSNFNLQN